MQTKFSTFEYYMKSLQSFIQLSVLLVIVSCFIQCYKPSNKRQQAVWRLECELGVVSDPECPVDGGWSPWTMWSPCRGSCDDVGHKKKSRRCVNPVPSEDGLPCEGPEEEIQQCFLTNCTVQDYRELIQGDVLRIEAFHQLEAVPALMERCLPMECPYETVETAFSDDSWQVNPETIWNALQCVKHNIGCPVIGEWGTWGVWSACGARCGRGRRWRLRSCDTPRPSHAHLVCTGTPLQSQECEGQHCAGSQQNIAAFSGQWGEWVQWSACSETCGSGVRRRQRVCQEKYVPRVIETWGTNCVGPHDQIEVCENYECVLDGSWSGWSSWGPCSQTCGAGKKSRTRSCSRPVPAGGGTACAGPKEEMSSCYLSPCKVYTHNVALLNGESSIHYNFRNKQSTLFHLYVRFMPLSPHGTLARRGFVHNPQVRLSLQKGHICLDASGLSHSCTLSRICSPSVIEPAVWHSCLIAVTNEDAILRIDDALDPIRGTFSCDPELPRESVNLVVGERLHGEIQEITLNFIPLDLFMEHHQKRTLGDFRPTSASNVVYETAAMEEGYLHLSDQYMRVPCFEEQADWFLELTIMPKRETGTILFLLNNGGGNWLHMALQNSRLKLKASLGNFKSESSSSTDCPPNEWLDVTLAKKRDTNAIEASINAAERIHIVLDRNETQKRRRFLNEMTLIQQTQYILFQYDGQSTSSSPSKVESESIPLPICNDEFFIGGIPKEITQNLNEDFTAFFGIVASLNINNVMQDLHTFSIERSKDDTLQLMSRTASVSGSYHETFWGKSNHLNLTCLHARYVRSPHTARWLFLDTGVTGYLKGKTVRSVDDGRVLKLVSSGENDLRGFYTCRAHTNKRTRNVVTYGVVGKAKYTLSNPDTISAIAVFTSVSLVLISLAWLIVEGINDLRNGYGFFRDAHLTPQEETEVVCKFIDDNIDLIGSKSAAEMAKERARQKGKRLASKASFAAQEPQGLLQERNEGVRFEAVERVETSSSEPESLPALPEATTSMPTTSHDVYRNEPSYVSSPRHGSNITTTKLESSSSFEMSPRLLCSRLFLTKYTYSPRDSLLSQRSRTSRLVTPRLRSNLLTIKSSTFVKQSPAQKVLQKFKQLKTDD